MNAHIELAANYLTYSFFGVPIFIHKSHSEYYIAMDNNGSMYAFPDIPVKGPDGIWRNFESRRTNLINLNSLADYDLLDINLVEEMIKIASTQPYQISSLPLLK